MRDYLLLFSFLIIVLAVGLVLQVASLLLTTSSYSLEQVTAFESGFAPFDNTWTVSSVAFYRIGILFIIFDVEAVLIYPWTMNMEGIGVDGWYVFLDFIGELLVALAVFYGIGSVKACFAI